MGVNDVFGKNFGKRGALLYRRANKNKYNAIKTYVDGILFDSKGEAALYAELKLRFVAKEITNLQIHPRYPTEINGVKICDVELDFEYFDFKDNKIHYVDFKGKDTDLSKLKRKMIEAAKSIKVEIIRRR